MINQLLVLTAVIAILTFVRLIQRFDAEQRGYLMVVGVVLVSSCWAIVMRNEFVGVAAIALCALTVVLPWLLEAFARLAFGRNWLRLAVALTGIRAMLMPGAGLGRQQEILQGLALLERKGVDAALSHLRSLAGETEDGGELALIHEQIVSMLFYGQRWDEGIAHYEGRFHRGYAAVRPALALGLLRAYGESGKLVTAAALLRALEEGPLGADSRAVGLLCQARLTFLAFVGSEVAVQRALVAEHLPVLGVSPATGAFYRGIALARAGKPEQAQLELRQVERLAGPGDARTVTASRLAMAAVDDNRPAVSLDPELTRFASAVAERLHRFLAGAPTLRKTGPLVATPVLVVAAVLGHVVTAWGGEGGLDLLRLGALTPELWYAGSWGRILTGALIHPDIIGLLIAIYGTWLGGPVIERLVGSARLLWVGALGAIVGGVVSVAASSDPSSVIAVGVLASFAIASGALWILLPAYTPRLARRSRRALAIPLLVVFMAHGMALAPGVIALDLSPLGLLAAASVAVLLVGVVPADAGRGLQRTFAAGGWLFLVVLLAGAAQIAREDVDAFVAARRKPVELAGVMLDVPRSFERTPENRDAGFPLPVYQGLIDGLSVRTGDLVQVLVVTGHQQQDTSALLTLDPELGHELDPVEVVQLDPSLKTFAADNDVRIFELWRNGKVIGKTFERVLAGGEIVVLLLSPASTWEVAPQVHRAIIRDAHPIHAAL